MIKERTPVALQEVSEIVSKLKETDKTKTVLEHIEKFGKLDPAKAKALKESIESLNMIKLKSIDIIKIVDLAPENATELNKIFTEISLDADETNKILETIKSIK